MGTVFDDHESAVRSYSRSWPVVFDGARDGRLYAEDGTPYVDFFCGAGALNYGHNHPLIKEALLRYLADDRVIHSLDMSTVAKEEFLERFWAVALKPRALDYKVQFTGPTGTNAVEAALKLARKVTGRDLVVGFTNAFHGMTLGALSVTGNAMKRGGAGVPLNHSASVPFCNFLEDDVDSIEIFRALIEGSGSGMDLPAAVIVETVQGEGGINVASVPWLRKVADLCAEHGILLVVDDVQMGCGRTGPFFSFEDAGIVPDIVTMAKSLSGIGLPLAVTLMRPDLDVWQPGEHNGTFRGNNPAFVTATAALGLWEDGGMADRTVALGAMVEERLGVLAAEVADRCPGLPVEVRGKGLVWGLAFPGADLAPAVCRAAFERGLLVETSGPDDDVVKIMPPLTASADEELAPGLETLGLAVRAVLDDRAPGAGPADGSGAVGTRR